MARSQASAGSMLAGLLKITALSTVAGVLSMALFAPLAVFASTGASAGLALFDNLPSYLKPVNFSQSSTLYANSKGAPVEVATFYHENRIWVPFEQISPNLLNAVIATEDPRFYQHGGVDILALMRAAATNAAIGGGGPGASTITMQYVKNSLVEEAYLNEDEAAIEAATEVSIDRKIREMRLAIALEQQASKEDILAGYLNLAFFGNQLNGVESASNYYFGVSSAQLDVPQAALLAAMLKSPNDYKPDNPENLDRAKSRRDYVIDKMAEEGYLTADEAATAKNTPITVNLTETQSGCEASQETAFFCDFVVWTIRNSTEFGATPADRENLLRRGGLQIYSTLNLDLQKTAQKAVNKYVPAEDPSQLGASIVSVEAGTGRILAMAQNRIFDQSDNPELGRTSVNYNTDKPFGGSSGFQSGSTYKIFTLAQWLKSGYSLNDHVDARVKEWNAADFAARCGGLVGTWEPGNDSKAAEDLTVVQATAQSVNTAFASMASQLDLCDIRDTAMSFGIHRADGRELEFVPSSILGVNEIAPLSMAGAMAALANNGVYCSPVAIDRVVLRKDNSELRVPTTSCALAVTQEIAAGITYAMQRVIAGGTGGASSTGDGIPLAGKTGTTDEGVHTWMTGFSSEVGTATWVGNVVGNKSLRQTLVNGRSASLLRHDIWRTTMKKANKLYGGVAFNPPPGYMLETQSIVMPNVIGLDPVTAEELIEASQLNVKIMVKPVVSVAPIGTVGKTFPAAGEEVPRGTLIKIYISQGGSLVVPSVRGLSVADAKASLLLAGFAAVSEPQSSQFQYFLYSDDVPAGLVLGTEPEAGTAAEATGAILLIISKGPAG